MFILLAASLIPPFYLMWRVYQIDKIEKEPAGLLFNIFLLGMLSTLPAGIIESILSSIMSLTALFTAFSQRRDLRPSKMFSMSWRAVY